MQKPARVVTLEEHFYLDGFVLNIKPRNRLIWETGEARIEHLDRLGVDVQVLSLMSPGVQAIRDTAEAIRMAKWANDFLAGACAKYPTRLYGFAALPTQDGAASADELERCVKDYGFKGGLINDHTFGQYLDEDMYTPLWERATELGVPLYLHPAAEVNWHILQGYPELSRAAWGSTFETAAHALRVVGSGLFERMPRARMIVGHLGETIPYLLSRIDRGVAAKRGSHALPKKPSDYIRSNVVVTTAGAHSTAPMRCSIDALGLPSVMFSMDYPLDDNEGAMTWLLKAPMTDEERDAVAYKNAEAYLRL